MNAATRVVRWILALLPAIMLTVAIPFVNRAEPFVLGLPFLLAWICGWVLVTPLILYAIFRIEGRR